MRRTQPTTKRPTFLPTTHSHMLQWLHGVVVVYHVTIVSIGNGLVKKFWPFGNRLRATHCREFLYMKLCRPAYFVRTTKLLTHPGHEEWQVFHIMSSIVRQISGRIIGQIFIFILVFTKNNVFSSHVRNVVQYKFHDGNWNPSILVGNRNIYSAFTFNGSKPRRFDSRERR